MPSAHSSEPCETSSVRCGIVLAAGDGVRLRPFVRRLLGQEIPKQYVSFTGDRSMLEATWERAERVIPRERLYTVVGRDHLGLPVARRQLQARPRHTLVLQPSNRDTGPGLLLPLLVVHKRHPGATVAVLPADHFVREEGRFMACVESALREVERDPSRVVLLGIEPRGPEPEYGYILPAPVPVDGGARGPRPVERFVEKPAPAFARDLARRGGLWNTLVMAFNAGAFLETVRLAAPALSRAFDAVLEALDTPREIDAVAEAYRDLEPLNLSRGLLERLPALRPGSLAVLPVKEVDWCDWGSEERVLSSLGADLPLGPEMDPAPSAHAPQEAAAR